MYESSQVKHIFFLSSRTRNQVICFPSFTVFSFFQIMLSIALLYFIYVSVTLITFLIPLFGRNGLEQNPEILVSRPIIGMTYIVTSYCIPKLVRGTHLWLSSTPAAGYCIVIFLTVVCSGNLLAFPYSSDHADIAPKRLTVLHTTRERFAEGILTSTASGISVKDHDYRQVVLGLHYDNLKCF